MGKKKEEMREPDIANWWQLNQRENRVDVIQWTPAEGGWIRARMDSRTKFEYKKVGPAYHNPETTGNMIVERQQAFESYKR